MKKLLLTTLVLCFILPSFAKADITSNLSGWWKLDDGSGTSAVDSSGNGHTGSFIGTPTLTWINGYVGAYAASTSGSTGTGIDAGSTGLQPTSAGTFATWVYLRSTGSFQTILSNGSMGGSEANGVNVETISQKFVCSFNNGTTNHQQLSGTTVYSTGVWYHVACTWDSSNVNIYVNGVADATQAAQTVVPSPAYNFRMGTDGASTSGASLNGIIDDVRVYSRALTSSDITQLYGYMHTYTFITATTTTTWTVPSDWNNSNNTIEVIGGGGAGRKGSYLTYAGNGGGGGAYAKVSNVTLTPGSTINIQVGDAGTTTDGTASYVKNNSNTIIVLADPGHTATTTGGTTSGGPGGYAALSTGDVKYSGGNGGTASNATDGGSGGGGAAGPNGDGGNGGTASQNKNGGSGGGGNGGGSNGVTTSDNFAGSNGGDNVWSTGHGTGGAFNANGTSGTNGGGGGGAGFSGLHTAGNGGNGTEWDATHGSGGGGGAGASCNGSGSSIAGNGGTYGGGGGGTGCGASSVYGKGGQGIIVITYTPTSGGGGSPILQYIISLFGWD